MATCTSWATPPPITRAWPSTAWERKRARARSSRATSTSTRTGATARAPPRGSAGRTRWRRSARTSCSSRILITARCDELRFADGRASTVPYDNNHLYTELGGWAVPSVTTMDSTFTPCVLNDLADNGVATAAAAAPCVAGRAPLPVAALRDDAVLVQLLGGAPRGRASLPSAWLLHWPGECPRPKAHEQAKKRTFAAWGAGYQMVARVGAIRRPDVERVDAAAAGAPRVLGRRCGAPRNFSLHRRRRARRACGPSSASAAAPAGCAMFGATFRVDPWGGRRRRGRRRRASAALPGTSF